MTAPVTVPRRAPRWLHRQTGERALIVVAAAIAGFLLVGQVRGDVRTARPLEAESEGDLARILASLNAEADALQNEVAVLKLQLADLRQTSRRDTAAAEARAEQLRTLQVLAGTVPVTGPGIVVTVNDSGNAVRYDDLIDVVQELRDAGAEAIAVNGRRVGVTSAFWDERGRIVLDGQRLVAPYRIEAIGQPATLEGGLKIPGGAIDSVAAQRGGSVRVEVRRQADLHLPALEQPPALRVARPVGSTP